METKQVKNPLYMVISAIVVFALFAGGGRFLLNATVTSRVVNTMTNNCGYNFTYTDNAGNALDIDGVVTGNDVDNLSIQAAPNTRLEIVQVDSSRENSTQLSLVSGDVIAVSGLNIRGTQSGGSETAGISVGTGDITIELQGDNYLTSTTAYTLNVAGHLTITGDGSLTMHSEKGYGVRLSDNNSSYTQESGQVSATGTIGISRGTNKVGNVITVNGGTLYAEGTNGVALGVALGEVILNGGVTTLNCNRTYNIYGTLKTTANPGAGVLCYNQSLESTGDDLNLILMDLSPNQTDPYYTLYNSSTTVTNTAEFFGQVLGNVQLKEPFTIQPGWLIDVLEGNTLRHRAANGVNQLTIEREGTAADVTNGVAVHGELRFQGVAYDYNATEEANKAKAPFLWEHNGAPPAGVGKLTLVLSDDLLGSDTYEALAGTAGFVSNGTMEYSGKTNLSNGGYGAGSLRLDEAGYHSSTTNKGFWNNSVISIKYTTANGYSLGNNSKESLAGTYDVTIQSFGWRILTPTGMISKTSDPDGGLMFTCLEQGKSQFTVTPFDFEKDNRATDGTLVFSISDTPEYTLDAGGNLGDLFNATNISLACNVRSGGNNTMVLGKDYELTLKNKTSTGTLNEYTIDLVVVGMGNYTGEYVAKEGLEVKQVLGELGGAQVTIDWDDGTGNGNGKVYVKPDGTIDLDTMQLKTADGDTIAVGDGYDYNATVDHSAGSGSLQYIVTIFNQDTAGHPNDRITFTVTAESAGSGSTFSQGELNLVELFYQRPDSNLYPQDLLLSNKNGPLTLGTNYTVQYYNGTGFVVWEEYIPSTAPKDKNDPGNTDEFTVIVTKVGNADQVEFNVQWAEGGSYTGNDFGSGILHTYDENTVGKIYVAEGFGVVLSTENLGIDASVYVVVDTDSGGTTSNPTVKDIIDADVESLLSFAAFQAYTQAIHSPGQQTGTTQIVSSEGINESYTQGDNYPGKSWSLTLKGVGSYTGESTFQVPYNCIEFISMNENIVGVLEDYLILDPNPADLYQKPDGTLHQEDLAILEHRLPTINSNGTLNEGPLSTTHYSIATPIIKSTQINHTDPLYLDRILYDMTVVSPNGVQMKTLEGVDMIQPIYVKPAGTGSTFRHGALSLTSDQVVDYVAPTGDEGSYTDEDMSKVFSQLKIYKGNTLLTYGTQYTVTLQEEFMGASLPVDTYAGAQNDIYNVTVTDPNDSNPDTNAVTFEMKITMVQTNGYTLYFDGNWGSVGILYTQKSSNDYEYVNFPANPTQAGYNFVGWGTTDTATTPLVSGTKTYRELTTGSGTQFYGTLYAIWEALEPNHIYFDWNFNGQGVWTDIPKSADGDEIAFPTPLPVREGYVFTGWKDEDGNVLEYQTPPLTTYGDLPYKTVGTIADVAFVYAQWAERDYTLNFVGNGDYPSSLQITGQGWFDQISIPNPADYTKTGYDLVGWFTQETGGTKVEEGMSLKQLYPSLSATDQTSFTLYTQWTLSNTGGGSGGGDTGGSGGGSTGGTGSGGGSTGGTGSGGSTGGTGSGGSTGGTGSGGSTGGTGSGGSTGGTGGSDGSTGGTGGVPPETEGESDTVVPTVPGLKEDFDLVKNPATGENTLIIPVDTTETNATVNRYHLDDALVSGSLAGRGGFDLVVESTNDAFNLTLERSALVAFSASAANSLSLVTDGVIITFDRTAVNHILNNVSTSAMISVGQPDYLNAEAQAVFGGRPFYNLQVLDQNGVALSHFGDGLVKVSMDYQLQGREEEGNIIAGRVNFGGAPEYQLRSFYDGKYLQWMGSELGIFGIAYRDTTGVFRDMTGHWSEGFLTFTDSRHLYTIMRTLSVEEKITRGMYVTVLGTLEGIDTVKYAGHNKFTDVASSSPYAPYIHWAFELGIVDGIGNNQFAPDAEITREQMAVMLRKYVENSNYDLPVVVNGTVNYNDKNNISFWAKDAVDYVQSVGLMEGTPTNDFLPGGIISYGEHAVTVMRLVECILSINTVYLG